MDQKANRPATPQSNNVVDGKKKRKKGCLIAILIFLAMAIIGALLDNSAPNGYYNYQGTQYYHQGSSWYYYDAETDDWYKSSDIDINSDNANDYRTYQHSGKDFEQSTWYDAGSHSNDYDWDDDDDWDSGSDSWDSGGTDWDSDW